MCFRFRALTVLEIEEEEVLTRSEQSNRYTHSDRLTTQAERDDDDDNDDYDEDDDDVDDDDDDNDDDDDEEENDDHYFDCLSPSLKAIATPRIAL